MKQTLIFVMIFVASGCATVVYYQKPNTGPVSEIRVENPAPTKHSSIQLARFDDAETCAEKQWIFFFANKTAINGTSDFVPVTAGVKSSFFMTQSGLATYCKGVIIRFIPEENMQYSFISKVENDQCISTVLERKNGSPNFVQKQDVEYIPIQSGLRKNSKNCAQ